MRGDDLIRTSVLVGLFALGVGRQLFVFEERHQLERHELREVLVVREQDLVDPEAVGVGRDHLVLEARLDRAARDDVLVVEFIELLLDQVVGLAIPSRRLAALALVLLRRVTLRLR